jgi:hypothetical protein
MCLLDKAAKIIFLVITTICAGYVVNKYVIPIIFPPDKKKSNIIVTLELIMVIVLVYITVSMFYDLKIGNAGNSHEVVQMVFIFVVFTIASIVVYGIYDLLNKLISKIKVKK